MRRKLLVINLVLVAAAAFGIWQFRAQYRQARDRYGVLQTPKRPAPPAPAPAAAVAPVQPASFLDAAQKYLFTPDRNPTVVVEVPKPKPRPRLPQVYGVMNIGGGPLVIMGLENNSQHKTVRIGETIGEFKLLAAAGDQITLEWEGEKIEARLSDLIVRGPRAETSAPGPNPGAAVASAPAVVLPPGSEKNNPAANQPRPGGSPFGGVIEGGPGNTYYSAPGDSAPAGAVVEGKRKVVRSTPFGTQSWWEDAK